HSTDRYKPRSRFGDAPLARGGPAKASSFANVPADHRSSQGRYGAARKALDRVMESLAGQPQWRPLAAFEGAQPRRLPHDVVAGHRHDTLALGELQLHHHQPLLAERHLRGGEIEFPHAD